MGGNSHLGEAILQIVEQLLVRVEDGLIQQDVVVPGE
jgi:hypothetical protein